MQFQGWKIRHNLFESLTKEAWTRNEIEKN